ncbi:MAG: FAD-dependent oxidoreductase [Pseudomonadota bacterium]
MNKHSDDFQAALSSLSEVRRADSFEFSVPVIVAGAGAAGQCAALAAADGGAEVWLLERDATPKGSTAMSEGAICAAASKSQIEAGITDSPALFAKDIIEKTGGKVDPDFAQVIATEAGPTVDWLIDTHGLPLVFDHDWEACYGHSVQRLHKPPSGTGEELISALANAAETAGVQLITSAKLSKVYRDDTGAVTGVCVERPTGESEDIGCGALILATCGFGANPNMIAENIPSMKDAFYWGHEGNDGFGIRVGQALGGATQHMDAYQGLGLLAKAYGEIVHPAVIFHGGVLINTDGERFEHEVVDVSGQGARIMAQPDQSAWAVFNTGAHEAGLKTAPMQKIDALGGIKRADTVEDLAGIIGCPVDALTDTLAHVSETAKANTEDRFGRPFEPSDAPDFPLYTAKVTGALFHTQGGLIVDGHGQVLREDGAALPNLFAAGGTARSISGPGPSGYLPAAGLCMAVTLGRLAGEQAAKVAGAQLLEDAAAE